MTRGSAQRLLCLCAFPALAALGAVPGAPGCEGSGCAAAAPSLLQARRQASSEASEATLRSVLGVVERLEEGVSRLEKRDLSLQKELQDSRRELADLKEEDASLKEEVGRLRTSGVDSAASGLGPLFSPTMSALLEQFHNESSELRGQCKRTGSFVKSETGHTPAASSTKALPQTGSRQKASKTACGVEEVALLDFSVTGVAQSCCPVSSRACAGCSSYSQGKCQSCAEGFLLRDGACTACTSAGAWLSQDGKSCFQLEASECSDVKVRGQSSKEACCQCGGGVVTPTPFSYPSRRWSLDSEIVLMPEPRTAERYTVDAQCELAMHNLTMDSTTGKIFYMPGRSKPLEAFAFECEVTAHQAPGVILASVVTVAADLLSYRSATLLFHPGAELLAAPEVPLVTGAGWSQFELGCAPEVAWLGIDVQTGTLSFLPQGAAAGGISVADEKFYGQDGAVCAVTAWQAKKQHKASFVSIRPRPWSTFEYDLAAVAVSIGEELHPLLPKSHTEQGLMKPWTYSMACDVSGADAQVKFSFDRVLSMGLLAGHPILDIGPEGEITVAPAPSLGSFFDASVVAAGSARKAATLHCRVFGIFPDPALPPVETSLSIEVQDTVCWVPQSVKAVSVPDATANSEAQCRARCRADETCANYKFDSRCERFDARSDGEMVTVTAKVTNCTNEGTCMTVSNKDWYLGGLYCPLGRDVAKGGIVYLRQHATPEDMRYLRLAQGDDGCTDGQWVLANTNPNDFVDKALGIYELRGSKRDCIEAGSVQQALRQCSTKELAFIEMKEEGEEGQTALVLDDPSTPEPADYWLHPCDCAPSAWGPELPVDPQMFEHLPAASDNNFIPTPYTIVTGQLTCPSRQLLQGGLGIHFQSEEQVLEPSDCEARCREEETCAFFWHGSQHGAATCRLFSGCDNLVREFSLEGDLKVMPRESSCSVADAAKCWATSLRRSFLTMAFNPTSSSSSDTEQQGRSLNLPPRPSEPTAEGMVAWFKSEYAGSVWPSAVGGFEGRSEKNSVDRKVEAGWGADRPVTYLSGDTSSRYHFGNILKPTYTLCSVTRYTGSDNMNRVLETKGPNWYHGHCCRKPGSTYHDGFLTDENAPLSESLDWLVMCSTNDGKRTYSNAMGNTTVNVAKKNGKKFSKDMPLIVNDEQYGSKSDYGVMEIITWDRALSEEEMQASMEYLKWRLRAGSVLEVSEHLARHPESNFDSFGDQNMNGIEAQTFDVSLANGYSAQLSGWTNTRSYGRGFLRNKDGKATAVVKGLTPAAMYVYELFQVGENPGNNWVGQCKISVNHGRESRGQSGPVVIPRFSGVATANPRGEIVFEFERISVHVYISGISVAKPSTSVLLQQSVTSKSSSDASDAGNVAGVWSGFLHLHLYQQCDAVLLLGGMGVQQCARPGHRVVDSHAWQHKRPLPKSFEHGAPLTASCWSERYRLLRKDAVDTVERLQCVNGIWYNGLGLPGLRGISCESCVQVAAGGYAAYDERNEQELYFFNRMALSIYTELGMIKELSENALHKHCLEPAAEGKMTVTASAFCAPKHLAQVNSETSPESRSFRLIPEDFNFSTADTCLSSLGRERGLQHQTCRALDGQQHLLPAEIPTRMWDLHIKADERTQDAHAAYASYCGTSGALSDLDFGQLFGGQQRGGSKCKFAPLIEFGEFQDTSIVREKTSTNWADWHHLLAESPVECAEGEALTALKLDAAKKLYRYECSKIGGLGSCFDYFSAQVEIKSFGKAKANWETPLSMMPVSCGQNAVLGGFHFEFSEGGKWGRARYQCCKAGGAPVTFDPRGQVPQLISHYDNIYCPSGRGNAGRLQYASGSGSLLAFDRKTGKWCMESECTSVTDSTSPIAVGGAAFDVVNVSDFDGEFLGASMPKEGGKGLSLAEALKMPPPKRPKPPPMPELEEFKAQQPTYSAECLNYENLWKEVSETFKDAEDNEVQKASKLQADASTKDVEMEDYHPCEVAKNAGGIFGPWGGGDGSNAPENMMYADWNDCMQGDIDRDLASAKLDYHSALTDFVMDLTEETMGAVCTVIPDVMIAPFGAGISLNPSEICDGIAELLGAVKNFAGPVSGFAFAKTGWDIEQEGYAACNPMQIGFARAFCDIHCVRDAVIRGDRSIIRNLETATKKTNNNMKALVKWSVDSARAETGWLGDKLDYMHVINTAYLKEIHTMLTQSASEDESGLLQATQASTDAMFAELSGFAQGASFDELSRLTAKEAIDSFLQVPDLPSAPNTTAAQVLLERLDAMHQTLGRLGENHGRGKSEMLARQMARTLRQLQRQASFQLRTLGVYRQESNASSLIAKSGASSRERHEVLVSLDHIWWQLRAKLDAYLDVAEEEVEAFQSSLLEMRSYMDCQKGFRGLASSYTANMATLRRSHRHLRSAWRQGSNLLGELASVLADSEAFRSFVAEEGCHSPLLQQTLQQLQSSIFGMAFLLHRFRASKLPEPTTGSLKQATQRIQQAYAAATASCS